MTPVTPLVAAQIGVVIMVVLVIALWFAGRNRDDGEALERPSPKEGE